MFRGARRGRTEHILTDSRSAFTAPKPLATLGGLAPRRQPASGRECDRLHHLRNTARHKLLHGTETALWNGRLHFSQIFRPELIEPFGVNVSRQDRIDRDPARRQFDRRSAHESQLPRLTRPVMRPTWIARDRACDGRSDHDSARPHAPIRGRRPARSDRRR